MDFWVGGVVKLAGHKVGVGVVFHQFFGFGNRATHTLGSGGEDEFRAIGTQQHSAFFAHAFRHDNYQFIAFGGAHHRQANACVARGGFYDGAACFDFACFLGVFHHRNGDAVFHAACGVEKFQFNCHAGGQALRELVKLNKRRVAD